jgi:endonuclease YncB( thermonuclease family)
MRNKIIVTAFLLGMIAFTALMTFYVGPKMMGVREEVAQDKHFYKCQQVLSGSELELQLRGWERPNNHPMIPVILAGVSIPPLGSADDPEVVRWARNHRVEPAHASTMGEAAYRTLLAFIRKQNLIVQTPDGQRIGDRISPGTAVHVFVSGTHVNRKLLQSGLALVDPATSGIYTDLYRQAEEQAKSAKLALWE